MDKRAFLYQEAPPGYVAGVGRGASGFTTSADHGSVRFEPGLVVELEDEEELAIEDGGGGEDGLMGAGRVRDAEEDEADRIYSEIDEKLRNRSRFKGGGAGGAGRGGEVSDPGKEVAPSERDGIKDQFVDLKRDLSKISDNEWLELPEAGDMTRRNKRARIYEQMHQRFYAVPDSVLAGAGSVAGLGGASDNALTNFLSISLARDKVLSSQLDNLVPATTTTETGESLDVDAQELDNQIADVKKARLILASMRKAEPLRASSWIASARLELQAKNYPGARKLISEGCRKVPHNEEIWLENVVIHKKSLEGVKTCKLILMEALKYNSKSEKLWVEAFHHENSSDVLARKRVLMRALESIPTSVAIWKLLVELEEAPSDVKKLLHKATELCPSEWNFWLTLINLSDYKEAKGLLNKARKSMEPNLQIWVTGAKLEERENHGITNDKLIQFLRQGLKDLAKTSNSTLSTASRKEWIGEGVKAIKEGFSKTAHALVINGLNIAVPSDDETKLSLWLDEANELLHRSEYQLANWIFEYIVSLFPHNLDCWTSLFECLKKAAANHPDFDKLFSFYGKAIEQNPEEELLYLMYAKDKWVLANDPESAKTILLQGRKKLPTSESIWLAIIKLKWNTGRFEEAQEYSLECIKSIPESSARVWYKYIHLERFLNIEKQVAGYREFILLLCDQAIEKFPQCSKLYLQKGSILEHDLKDFSSARETYSIGVKRCVLSVDLWISMAKIDEVHSGSLIKLRSTYDRAISAVPTSDKLWYERIQLEKRNGDKANANQICNRASKKFPNSPLIWIEHLKLIPKMAQRKNVFLDALNKTNNSPSILLSIGVFFWLDQKYLKAKSWFERALSNDKSIGDSWGWLYAFTKKNGTSDELTTLEKSFEESFEDINKGEAWVGIKKQVKNFNKPPSELLSMLADFLVTSSEV